MEHLVCALFDDELPTLSAFADQVAIAIESARLLSENRQRAEELELHHAVGRHALQAHRAAVGHEVGADRVQRLLDALAQRGVGGVEGGGLGHRGRGSRGLGRGRERI